jgi:DNA-binding LacI/PurR family transcriptional regulator
VKNIDVRLFIQSTGLKYKEVAEQMGVTNVYLSRVLKEDLKPEMRNRIIKAVNELMGA